MPYASADREACVELRTEVLRKPLGLEFTPEFLAQDREQTLIAAFDSHGKPVACLLLTMANPDESPPTRAPTEVQMRQVAVAPNLQGKGVGRRLVEFSENWLRGQGCTDIVLHARDTAIPFYLALSYVPEGEIFTQVGIPHQTMRKKL